ncbi:hypothetical protein D3C87_1317510 [compost metagenome]
MQQNQRAKNYPNQRNNEIPRPQKISQRLLYKQNKKASKKQMLGAKNQSHEDDFLDLSKIAIIFFPKIKNSMKRLEIQIAAGGTSSRS